MTDLEDVRNFLKSHNYLVTVKPTGSGCLVQFPTKTLEGTFDVEYTVSEEGISIGGQILEIPRYAWRTYILSSITNLSKNISYNAQLITFYDNEGNEIEEQDFIDALPIEKLEDEDMFKMLVIDAYSRGFPPEFDNLAARYEFSEGFNIIKQVIWSEPQ